MNDHAGELLSALLDGQLTAVESSAVRTHLATCVACTNELDEVREARRLVRELPAVAPPAWFLAELLAGDDVTPFGRRSKARVASAAGIVVPMAAGLLLLVMSASSIGPAAVQPELTGAVARHASTVSALLGSTGERLTPSQSVVPTTALHRDAGALPAPYGAPTHLDRYDLVGAYRSPGGVHLLYQDGNYGLSVFELPGSVDWAALPVDGTVMTLAGHRAWRWDGEPAGGRLVVLEDDGMVVIVVGDEPGEAVANVAAGLPSARPLPMQTRLRRAVGKALELFSPAP